MFKRKKGGMIDVRELAKQGKITPIGTKTLEGQSNNEGFVELGGTPSVATVTTPAATTTTSSTVGTSTMNFFDTPTPAPSANANTNLIERITAISKKVSKIEQRLEVIERKLGVGDSAPPAMW